MWGELAVSTVRTLEVPVVTLNVRRRNPVDSAFERMEFQIVDIAQFGVAKESHLEAQRDAILLHKLSAPCVDLHRRS